MFDSTAKLRILMVSSLFYVICLITYIYRKSKVMGRSLSDARSNTDPHSWKGRLIYYNPADDAIVVPKRYGFGYTVNFGHPVMQIISGGVLIAVIVLVIFGYHAQTR
jgi:uncharacterized membrane protein